jgi:anti-sigma regulatory factor (Ser/Thr protein kinase)
VPDPGASAGDISATLRIDSGNESDLARLHPWFDNLAQGLPASVCHAMRVALEEAVMNVAMHAYPAGTAGEITVTLRLSPEAATVIVEDSGCEFDPVTPPARPRPAGLPAAEPGGLGLTLLHHYCQDITRQRIGGQNRLILRFPLHSGPIAPGGTTG